MTTDSEKDNNAPEEAWDSELSGLLPRGVKPVPSPPPHENTEGAGRAGPRTDEYTWPGEEAEIKEALDYINSELAKGEPNQDRVEEIRRHHALGGFSDSHYVSMSVGFLLAEYDKARERAVWFETVLDRRDLLEEHCGWYQTQKDALADALRGQAESQARIKELEEELARWKIADRRRV